MKRTIKFIGILLTVLLFLIYLIDHFISRNSMRKLTGLAFSPKIIYSLDEQKNIFNDGRYIEIILLTKNQSDYFINEFKNSYYNYPINGISRGEWIEEKWKKTPASDSNLIKDINYFGQVNLKNESKLKDLKIQNLHQLLNEILTEADNYYAFNHKNQGMHFDTNFDIYVLSPKRNILLIINLNT